MMKLLKFEKKDTSDSSDDLVHVFVYGTLKVGFSLAQGMDQYRIDHTPAVCYGARLYHNDIYPMLVESNMISESVKGQVHTYKRHCLEKLDMIEGYHADTGSNIGWVRDKIWVVPEGTGIPTLVYAYPWRAGVEGCTYVEHGVWLSMFRNPIRKTEEIK